MTGKLLGDERKNGWTKITNFKIKIEKRTHIEYGIKYQWVKDENKYEEPYLGPYEITEVWTNGNFTIGWGTV